jgi:DNA-binding CsgD family transcriptional regulator
LLEQIARRADRGGEDPFGFVHLSGVTALLGRLAEARSWAERALESYAREGPDLWPAFALRGLALVAALQGHVEEARNLSSRGLDLATASGDLVVAILHRQVLALISLSTDDLAEADLELTAAAALAERVGAKHPLRFRLEGDQAEVALALGDLDRARAAAERLERAGALAPTPWTLAIGARCRGLVEAAAGDLDGAAAALERAMVEHGTLPMPFERGRTLLVKGQVHRRRKERGLADRSLREAVRIFEELGAPLWAQKARRELARVGLRPTAPSELTGTERRVAELAAKGLSSREIAEVAFMAPKTVGNVLGRVYRKLGIGSRAELGARMSVLAERPPPDALGSESPSDSQDR